jgi:anthranilate synthase component 1
VDRHLRWLDHVPDLLGLAAAHPEQFPFLLESTAHGPLGGHSMLLFATGQALVSDPETGLEGPGSGSSFFDRFQSWFERERCEPPGAESADAALPFIGGWFVYLGYEVAEEIEPTLNLPPNRTGLPDALAVRCPGAIIVFHEDQGKAAAERVAVIAETREVLNSILHKLNHAGSHKSAAARELTELNEEDPEAFKSAVRRIHRYLLDGDVFQVNISRPWAGSFAAPADPYDLYDSLRGSNPAPFAGLMRWQDCVMLSSSPERLVQVKGNEIQTRPIAGTRPRGGDAQHDEHLSNELISNPKERAEHIMLIDLERNDLGRVCQPGSVEVSELMVIESYAHVHHIVSNVRGILTSQASPIDAIKAVFPGGTITGCPKVRCMEIIAELEGEGRGFYTGSMGYIGRDGNLDLNILIRSMLVCENRITFRTGAGIVADSEPDRELLETEDKARGLLLALAASEGEPCND